MKILYIAWHLTKGDGWGVSACNTVIGMQDLDHEVKTLVFEKAEDVSTEQYAVLPEPRVILSNPISKIKARRVITKFIKELKPDIVHVLAEPYALAMPLGFLRKHSIPWVLTACGTYAIMPLHSKFTRNRMLRAYQSTAHVLSISDYTKKRVTDEICLCDKDVAKDISKKMSVFTLGIEFPHVVPPKEGKDMKHIIFVGGLKPRKGVMEVVEACAEFRKICDTPFQMHFIGTLPEDRYMNSVRTRVEELNLQNHIVFHGHISSAEISRHYSDADLFMMLSIPHGVHFEGFGLVFLEANARGVPVIGPNNSGCTNAISVGKSGHVVNPTDAKKAAEYMKWILKEGRISQDQCIAWAKEHSVERQAKEIEDIYTSVLSL